MRLNVCASHAEGVFSTSGAHISRWMTQITCQNKLQPPPLLQPDTHKRVLLHFKTHCSPQSGENYTVNLSCKNFLLEEGTGYYSCLDTQTQQHTQYIFYKGRWLSLGLIGAPASALILGWSFVSCFYLILFFHYSAKHIALGCDTVDLSLQLSPAKSGR